MDCKWYVDSFNLTEASAIGELISNFTQLNECSRQVLILEASAIGDLFHCWNCFVIVSIVEGGQRWEQGLLVWYG